MKGLWLLVAVIIPACGGEECLPSGMLGSCCRQDGDCGEFTCFKDLPGGLCSLDCSADHLCPQGSSCLLYESGEESYILCLPGCASGQAACRSGYECRLIPEVAPVCVPVR